jgi:hypothetical protein
MRAATTLSEGRNRAEVSGFPYTGLHGLIFGMEGQIGLPDFFGSAPGVPENEALLERKRLLARPMLFFASLVNLWLLQRGTYPNA